MSMPPAPMAANIEENPAVYWLLIIIGILIPILLLLAAYPTWSVPMNGSTTESNFNVGPGLIFAAFLYIALSLKQVGLDEVAGAFFYGRALVRLNAGLQYVPLGLMQVYRFSRTIQEFQAPGEPENVFKGDDKDPLPPGMVRPIRAVTRAPKSGETEILDAQMTLTLSFVVQYAVRDIFDYIANFGSKANVEIQLRDTGEATLSEKVTEHTPRTFIEALQQTNEELATRVRDRFLNSGVEIISVRLISPDISHDVSTSLSGIPAARARGQATIATAEAEKKRLTLEGEGTAAATLADLQARSDGRKKMMKDLEVDGQTIIAGEAVRDISDKTDVIIAGAEGGMRDLMGLVVGAKRAFDKTNGET